MRRLLRPWCWLRGHNWYRTIFDHINGTQGQFCARCRKRRDAGPQPPPVWIDLPEINLHIPAAWDNTRATYDPKGDNE